MHTPKSLVSTLKKLTVIVSFFSFLSGFFMVHPAQALTFTLPRDGNVVGKVYTVPVQKGDSLPEIGRRHDIGGYEMTEANPDINYLSPPIGKIVTIPAQFILPDAPRKGIVINLAEMRLYFYHPDGQTVSTYPIGIGKTGWLTPLGQSQIVRKRKDPWWIVPESIIESHKNSGKPIKAKMPPGPDNPLGHYAMNLGFKNIVIHGTPFPGGIGLRSSHGCIRMLPEDVEELFQQVNVGTSVHIVHQHLKVGRMRERLFLEAHMPLSEPHYIDLTPLTEKVRNLVSKMGDLPYQVRWRYVNYLKDRNNGYPEQIGKILHY